MATAKEKISFYLPADTATALRAMAIEQRRTVTAILETATEQAIADHEQANGSAASSQGKRDRAATTKG